MPSPWRRAASVESAELVTQLARGWGDRLDVIASSSVLAYVGSDEPIRQIGEELDVGFLLEGSTRRAGERLRITAQLIRLADEATLWAESYDRDPGDLLRWQVEVAAGVTASVAPRRYNGTHETPSLDPIRRT